MRRSRRTFVAGLLVGVGAVGLPAAAQAKIIVGQSIAGVKLGMTMAQVEKKLGPPSAKHSPDFKGDTEWNYAKKPLMGAMSFDTHGKLLGLFTSSPAQKTSQGIGPGASLAKVRRAYPRAKCRTEAFGPTSRTECVIRTHYHDRGVETLFVFSARSLREVNIDFVK